MRWPAKWYALPAIASFISGIAIVWVTVKMFTVKWP